jgi:hypothetical protein
MICGIISLFAGLVPFCGAALAIPLSIIGLVLAFVGFFAAAVSSQKGVGVPLLGGIVCAAALIFPFVVAGGFLAFIGAAQREGERLSNQPTTAPSTFPASKPANRR